MRKNALNFFCPFCSEMIFGLCAAFVTFDFLAGALLMEAVLSLFPTTVFLSMVSDAVSDSTTVVFPREVTGMFS